MATNQPAKDKKTPSISADQFYIYLYKFFWLIITILSLVVLAIGYQLFLLPKYNSIVSNQEIINKQQEYIDKSNYLNQLRGLKTAYEAISPEDREKIDQIVTTVNNQNDLYRETEYIIKKNGLTVEAIEPVVLDKSYDLPNISASTKKSPLLNNMKLTMTACKISNANYDSLVRVLKTFELNLRIMDVTKVEYDPASKKATLNFITYQF